MKIQIYWKPEHTNVLFQKVKLTLDELGLSDFIELYETEDPSIIQNLEVKQEPALIIEEESIDFKDVIFEWMIPTDEEIKSMLVSIIGWWGGEGWSCGSGWCGSCTWC